MSKRYRQTALNAFQIAAAKKYGGGDYAYMIDIKTFREAKAAYEGVGDTLFTFIMRELEDDGEPMDDTTSSQRMRTAMREVEEVVEAIEAI